jgi:hypothetical protein
MNRNGQIGAGLFLSQGEKTGLGVWAHQLDDIAAALAAVEKGGEG